MALGGTYQDHFKDMFKDVILLEAQQMGSRLRQAVRIETMSGNKTFFDKQGKAASYIKQTRNQKKTFADLTFERRQVQTVLSSYDTIFDREDLIKYVSDPKSSTVQSAVAEMGRITDLTIHNAIAGNAVVTTDGSTANQALTLSVAVDNHDYDSGSGDVALTGGKLRKALALGNTAHGFMPNERLICIAPYDQIINLSTEDNVINSDYRTKKPLEGPGIVNGISGFLGVDFIAYDEQTLVDGSLDERVFLISESAIRMGIFAPLTVEVEKQTDLTTNPDSLAVFESIGATRMYEEMVVEILCDPIA